MVRRMLAVAVAVGLAMAGCGGEAASPTTISTTVSDAATAPDASTTTRSPEQPQGCADVIAVKMEPGSSGFTISATVSSADEGWDKYADAWIVKTLSGELLGERILTHPHENEQPFTRSLSGVDISPEISQVVVAARDSVAGFCGVEFVAEVPHS